MTVQIDYVAVDPSSAQESVPNKINQTSQLSRENSNIFQQQINPKKYINTTITTMPIQKEKKTLNSQEKPFNT